MACGVCRSQARDGHSSEAAAALSALLHCDDRFVAPDAACDALKGMPPPASDPEPWVKAIADEQWPEWCNKIYFSVIFCFGGRKGISPCEPNQNLPDALTQILF